MTNKIPIITVKEEVKKVSDTNPNLRDVVCLIGGFEKEIEEPTFYTTLEAAETDLGTDTTLDANAALKQIFTDEISGVLVVDVTTHTGTAPNETYSRNVTKTKLENALASVAQMEFDMLYVVAELTDELVTVIDDDAQACFEAKKPYGWIGVGTRANASAYGTTAEKLGDFCYAFLTQQLKVKETTLSLIESGAWLTNYIARLAVGDSLTAKVLTDVTGVGTSYTFGDSDLGATLVGLGFFVVRLLSPVNKTYECVNSAGANGLDLYINRVRDYIVNDFALRQFLGEKNNTITLDGVKMECSSLLSKFRELGVVENITYAVEKKDSDKINVILNTIEFAGVITEIDVYITIEVI